MPSSCINRKWNTNGGNGSKRLFIALLFSSRSLRLCKVSKNTLANVPELFKHGLLLRLECNVNT